MPPFTPVWEADLQRLERSGARLFAAVPGAGLFTTTEWLGCAAAALPAARTLHVLYVFSGASLLACLPLTRGRETLLHVRATSLRLLGDPLADRLPLLLHPAQPQLLPFVLDQLLQAPFAWDVAIFNELPEDHAFRTSVEQWSKQRQAATDWEHCSRSPVLRLPYASTAELRTAYSRSLATRLRRSRKKLEAMGRVEFQRLLPSPEEAVALLPQLKEIEDVSWKGTAGVGIFSTAERCDFFRALSSRLAARKWLDIGLLRQEGRLISYRYGFRFQRVFLDYNLAFHPDWAPVAPGRILLEEMIASSVELGLDAVDASRSGLSHTHQLQEWTSEHLDHYQLWVFRRSWRGQWLHLLRTRLRPRLKKFLRRAEYAPTETG